jgi:hypothetical protein
MENVLKVLLGALLMQVMVVYAYPVVEVGDVKSPALVMNKTCSTEITGEVDARCGNRLCAIQLSDDVFNTDDINRLKVIISKGMETRKPIDGGPTILDINTGYIRDSNGLVNLFVDSNNLFTAEDFTHYGNIIRKLKNQVEIAFGISSLYFTAPTFITQLKGNSSWTPSEIHDEYWHPHADQLNTPHYHYSGLLYLSTYNADFNGGRLVFLKNKHNYNTPVKESDIELVVEPKIGRLAIFTSGEEHYHYVEKLTSGQRLVLSFWFTCNPSREFEIFLDGSSHVAFSNKIRDKISSTKPKNKEL